MIEILIIAREFLLDILYAPWRDKYINSCSQGLKESEKPCVFCDIWHSKDQDEKLHVLLRRDGVMVLLNAYPYAGGHLLVIPGVHVSDLHLCSRAVRMEIMEMVSAACDLLKKELGAMGVNIGMNIGAAAGAGIPDHVHVHLVPRWAGDTNFLPVIGNVKQISVDLNSVYKKLKDAFQNVQV